MKIKVIRARHIRLWYAGRIGEEFEVELSKGEGKALGFKYSFTNEKGAICSFYARDVKVIDK